MIADGQEEPMCHEKTENIKPIKKCLYERQYDCVL